MTSCDKFVLGILILDTELQRFRISRHLFTTTRDFVWHQKGAGSCLQLPCRAEISSEETAVVGRGKNRITQINRDLDALHIADKIAHSNQIVGSGCRSEEHTSELQSLRHL